MLDEAPWLTHPPTRVSRSWSLTIACLVLSLAGVAQANELAFVWWGEPDPSGVDQAFLALARRRGAAAVRETPGRPADEPLSARLARALALQQALDLKGAIAAFDDVEREAVARGGGTLSEGELTDLYAHRAGTRAALGDDADSWNDLVEAAALAPGRSLDPARFPPRLIEASRRAREALPPAGTLVVMTLPSDAVIIVDGQLYGRGRVEVPRPGGRHFIRVERAGYEAAGRVVESGAGATEVRIALQPAPGPSAAELARRGALADAGRTLGGYIAGGARAAVTLLLVERGGRVVGKASLPVDAELTSGALAGAVDTLLGDSERRGTAPPPPAWYRRPLVWGIAGGVAAAALGVGLGVGLGSRDSGVGTRVDLGPAR
jgi:PEGA domain-containing protein